LISILKRKKIAMQLDKLTQEERWLLCP